MEGQTMPFRPVEVQLGSTAYFTSAGGSLTVPFALTNRTGREDYFELTIQGLPMDWVLLDIPVIHLNAGERREASITVIPPAGSVGAYAVILRVAAQSDQQAVGEAGFDLRVSAEAASPDAGYATTIASSGASTIITPEGYSQTRPSGRAGRIVLMMDSTAANVAPGGRTSTFVRVSNEGLAEDTAFLTVEGIPGDWASLSDTAVPLLPGEQRDVTLYFQPPLTPTSRAGRHTFTVRAVSQADPALTSAVDGQLTVSAFSQFSADLSPRRMDAGQSARVRIFNQGNIQGTYTVTLQTRGDDLEIAPSQQGPIHVMPGEVASIDVSVSPSRPNWLSSPQVIPYSLVVTSSEGEAQAYNGEIVSRPLIPVWVLPAMLALCLTTVCGVGFLWNWNQNRLTSATETANFALAQASSITETAVFNQTQAVLAGQQDTDGDGVTDAQEAELGLNPQMADTDNDRLNDGDELSRGTDPLNPDTDGDGVLDGLDIDPLDANNPSLTATAAEASAAEETAAAATATAARLAMTDTPTPTLPVPTETTAAQPTLTATTAPPTATTAPTQNPLPVTGEELILFESNRDGNSDLYLFNTANSSTTRLTNNPGGADTQPAWSPDGARIVFVSNRDGNNEIYVMNVDGSGVANLTNNPADDAFPYWSPDGDAIVFATNRDGNYEIYVMQADGGGPTNLTNNPADDTQPFWYRDAALLTTTEGILFTSSRDGNNEVYAMSPEGDDLINLTNNPASDALPAVSPDGERFLFVTNRDGNSEIYRAAIDGSDLINLSNNPANDTFPVWSPDGAWISFATDRDGNPEIYVMDRDGSQQVNLSRNPAADLYPAWR